MYIHYVCVYLSLSLYIYIYIATLAWQSVGRPPGRMAPGYEHGPVYSMSYDSMSYIVCMYIVYSI